MTGASDNHIYSMVNCVLSSILKFPNSSVIILDYGLSNKSICSLSWLYSTIHDYHRALGIKAHLYYRKYNFNAFPSWMNITSKVTRGGYGWKVISIVDALSQWNATLMWNDAGNIMKPHMNRGFACFEEERIYVPYDKGTLRSTYSKHSYDFMVENKLAAAVNKSYSTSRAGFMLFDYRNSTIRDRILLPWFQCAFTQKCLMPKGERCFPIHTTLPEQGAMGMLLRTVGIKYSGKREYNYFPKFWNEIPEKQGFKNNLFKSFTSQIMLALRSNNATISSDIYKC